METITIEQLQKMIDNYQPRYLKNGYGERFESGLFIRWSTTPEADCNRGSSTNHATGESEMGLSVVESHHSQTRHGLDLGRTLRERVMEYSYLPGKPWCVEGYRIRDRPDLMRGSDGEPLVLWPKPIAWIEIT